MRILERPILFNAEMVEAILQGRKLKTRRLVKPRLLDGYRIDTVQGKFLKTKIFSDLRPEDELIGIITGEFKQPYQIGDTLWVRETWADLRGKGFDSEYSYLANNFNKNGFEDVDGRRCRLDYGVKWRPSIHMPRAAARLFLKVTNIRVERLQDITEEDAKDEGFLNNKGMIHSPENEYCRLHTAREHFISTWDNIYKNALENPWVWVIEFELANLLSSQVL